MTSHANSLLSRVNFKSTSHKQVLTAAVRMAMITRPKKSSKKDADQSGSEPDQSGSEPDQSSFEPARSCGSRRKSSTSSSLRSALEKVKDADVAEILDDASSDGFIDDDVTHTSPPIASSPENKSRSSSDDDESSSDE